MMPKGFIFQCCLAIHFSYFILAATNHRQISLGCQAVIPCRSYRSDSNSLKWLYQKDERSPTSVIYFRGKTGVEQRQEHLRSRIKVQHDGSLVVDHFTEDDQGLYWCENCFQDNCRDKAVISVEKEILTETQETLYVVAGSSFIQSCRSEFVNLKWTFEASNATPFRNSVQRPQSDFVTSDMSVHILNVERADAGRYTCWKSECDGHKQKLLTINLCVITVHVSEASSVSCAVICDMEFSNIKPNSTLKVKTGTGTVSVLVDPNGSLNCSTKLVMDGYGTVNSTHGPSNTLNATDIPTEPEHQFAVIYGTSAALIWLILMAVLICNRRRLLAAFPVHCCCCGLNGRVEEEASVIYSSVVFRRPAETTTNRVVYGDSDCVYSELKV